MAYTAVTYTLSNGSTADATQVNQNFTDIINGLSDGTKSLNVDALTCAGAATLNGNVTLGNGTPDDITISGSLAASIPIKTTNSYDIGSSTLGLASVYLGSSGGAFTTRLKGAAVTSSYTLTLPNGGGTAGQKIITDGSGTLSYANEGPQRSDNYGITATVSSNALTVSLVGANGSAISSTNAVVLSNRNATATTGTPTTTTLTSAPTACVVPDTATLGHISGVNQYVHVYLIMGTANEIALSGQYIFDENTLQNATAITTGADSANVLYATSNHTSKPIRYIGRLKSNQATAGTWATAIAEISLGHNPMPALAITDWVAYTPTFTGFGTTSSVDCYWRRVGDTLELSLTFVTGTCTATEGKITLPSGITASTAFYSGNKFVGVSKNNSSFTQAVLINSSDLTVIKFSNMDNGDTTGLTPKNANSIFNDSTRTSMWAQIVATGWSVAGP